MSTSDSDSEAGHAQHRDGQTERRKRERSVSVSPPPPAAAAAPAESSSSSSASSRAVRPRVEQTIGAAAASSTATTVAASSSAAAAAAVPSSAPSAPASWIRSSSDSGLDGCRSVTCYRRLNTIDEGTYGVVHRAVDVETGEEVALKKIKLDPQLTTHGFPVTSLREINLLMSLQHDNIVRLREVVTSGAGRRGAPKGIYMVMDYCPHDLGALMKRMGALSHDGDESEGGGDGGAGGDDGEGGGAGGGSSSSIPHPMPAAFAPFRVAEVKSLLRQLLTGLAHMHDRWMMHRDIKPTNLLYTDQGVLKIADFGMARRYSDPPPGRYSPGVVSLWYRAPEILFGVRHPPYTPAVDIWSAGCVFAELLSNRPLMSGRTEIDMIGRMIRLLGTPDVREWPELNDSDAGRTHAFTRQWGSTLRQRFPTRSFDARRCELSDSGFALLRSMLTYNPARRPTAAECLTHAYFTEPPAAVHPRLLPTFPSSNTVERVGNDDVLREGDLMRMKAARDAAQGFFM